MKSGHLYNLQDQSGKGLVGCIFCLIIFALIGYATIILGPIYYEKYSLETELRTVSSRAGANFFSDAQITKEVMDLAKRHEIKLDKEDVQIERVAQQVIIHVYYVVHADFGFFAKDLEFNIEESSFLGRL